MKNAFFAAIVAGAPRMCKGIRNQSNLQRPKGGITKQPAPQSTLHALSSAGMAASPIRGSGTAYQGTTGGCWWWMPLGCCHGKL